MTRAVVTVEYVLKEDELMLEFGEDAVRYSNDMDCSNILALRDVVTERLHEDPNEVGMFDFGRIVDVKIEE